MNNIFIIFSFIYYLTWGDLSVKHWIKGLDDVLVDHAQEKKHPYFITLINHLSHPLLRDWGLSGPL